MFFYWPINNFFAKVDLLYQSINQITKFNFNESLYYCTIKIYFLINYFSNLCSPQLAAGTNSAHRIAICELTPPCLVINLLYCENIQSKPDQRF